MTDTINTDIATTSVQTASTSSTTDVTTLGRRSTVGMTAKRRVDTTPTTTATSVRVTTSPLTITVTDTERRRIVTVPVPTLADIMQRNRFLRTIATATTPVFSARITRLTDSATHVQVTNHRQCVRPFQTVTTTPEITPATITAPRCRALDSALQVPVHRSPEKRVMLSAVFTPTGSVSLSRRTVRRSRRTTVSVMRIVPSLYRATAAVTLAVITRTHRATTSRTTNAAHTASTDSVTPCGAQILAAFATLWADCSATDIATTSGRRAALRTTETARVTSPRPSPKRREPAQTSADITTSRFDYVSTVRSPARTTPETPSATDTGASISRRKRAPASEDTAFGARVNTDETFTLAITTNSTAAAG